MTTCVLLLLPRDAMEELFVHKENSSVLVADEVLGGRKNDDDTDLRSLVSLAVLETVEQKGRRYLHGGNGGDSSSLTHSLAHDRTTLSRLVKGRPQPTSRLRRRRRMAGLVVQMEEKRSLRLRRRAIAWMK